MIPFKVICEFCEKNCYHLDVPDQSQYILLVTLVQIKRINCSAIDGSEAQIEKDRRYHHQPYGRCQKKETDLFGTLSQTMGMWVQVLSPKLFCENIHSVIFTTNIQKCPKTCDT